jgi:glutamate carboxypeptidase
MKAGLAIAFAAVAGLADRAGVTILVTGDEELGSASSRALIEEEAQGAAAALVLEAAADGGALKTARAGVSLYEVQVTGRAAHAGLDPERGINAAVEAAHQLLRVAGLAAPGRGTTVTPSRLSAGTTSNTVPARASFTVDVRARDAAEQERVHAGMNALQPVLAGAELTVSGGPNRPPLEAAASADLYQRAQRVAARLAGPPLRCAEVGGASDGNFTAGIGTPTLDGLGAVGGGAHADSEHVLVAELPGRVELLRGLVADLLAGQSGRTNPAAASGSARP